MLAHVIAESPGLVEALSTFGTFKHVWTRWVFVDVNDQVTYVRESVTTVRTLVEAQTLGQRRYALCDGLRRHVLAVRGSLIARNASVLLRRRRRADVRTALRPRQVGDRLVAMEIPVMLLQSVSSSVRIT